jgi:predicted Fe-Mo cluster-binding NifX family protein
MRIAVAVDEDKKSVVKRTGQSAYFAIFEDDKLVKYVKNGHGGGGGGHHHHHHHGLPEREHTNEHKRDIEALRDCDVMLVKAIGEHMKAAVESFGIEIKKIKKGDGESCEEVVKSFLSRLKDEN